MSSNAEQQNDVDFGEGTCGVCGCKSNEWIDTKFMGMPAGRKLWCPAYERNRTLHEKLDRKKGLLYDGVLPASTLQELKLEIAQMKKQLQAEIAAKAKS